METQTHIILNDEEKLKEVIEENAKDLANNFSKKELLQRREATKTEFKEYLSEHPNDTVTTPKRKDFEIKLKTYSRAVEMKTPKKS